MAYKHKFTQKLEDTLREMLGGGTANPLFKILWLSIKGEIPGMLKGLDENEEAIAALKEKFKHLLEEEKEESGTGD